MAEPYDLRSNLKNKPGAQGTLFQVKDKGLLNPQQRWPQGYTPERLNEVRDALKRTPVSAPEHMYDQPTEETQQIHGVNEYGYRERVHREIAKTTVPPEHLQGITDLHGEPDEGTHGTYTRGQGKRELAVDLTAGDRNEARKTLVHEIGHHVNMTLSPTPHVHDMVAQIHAHKDIESNEWRDKPNSSDVAFARSKVTSGVQEAQADDYMVEHYRTGGRKSTGVSKGVYEENFAPHARDAQYPGYNDIRVPGPSAADQALNEHQFNPGLFPKAEAVGGQQSPLQRRLAARTDANRRAVGDNL